jgi:hypothetical protein
LYCLALKTALVVVKIEIWLFLATYFWVVVTCCDNIALYFKTGLAVVGMQR